MLLELATGRKLKLSLFNSFSMIYHRFRILALIPIITVFFIVGYYIVVTGWTLAYFFNSFSGNYRSFEGFTSGYSPIFFSTISLIIAVGITALGVRKGIERSSKILIPFLFFILLIIFIQTVQLPKSIDGIIFYFTPNFSKLGDYRIWLLASAQALFSLSVGYGILFTYGSYLNKKINIFKSSLIITFTDTLVSLIAAMAIFSTLYSSNISPAEGPRLAFIVLPQIFQSIRFGFFLGSLFFLLLFIAAITSVISMIEVVTRNLKDYLKLEREKTSFIVFLFLLSVSIPVSLSYTGLFKINLLEKMDIIFGNYMTIISAIIITTFVAWQWKLKSLIDEMNIQLALPFDRWFKKGIELEDFLAYRIVGILIKFIVPSLLFLLLLLKIIGAYT
jgi:NSS family neurotransmitter:Na+ symporter